MKLLGTYLYDIVIGSIACEFCQDQLRLVPDCTSVRSTQVRRAMVQHTEMRESASVLCPWNTTLPDPRCQSAISSGWRGQAAARAVQGRKSLAP